jgi:hypothetical protein
LNYRAQLAAAVSPRLWVGVMLSNVQPDRRNAWCSPWVSPSHGENMGSSPLGSANDFSILVPKIELAPAGISNFSPMDGASDDLFEVTL